MEKKQDKTKEAFANAWKKASDFGKKAAEGTKDFVEQTKKNIHDQQAKKYTPVTAKEFKLKSFQIPSIINVEDDFANREFITDPDAIGWIEQHKDIPVLHMYFTFSKKCGLTFIPVLQREQVYCMDHFDSKKYIDSNRVFGKATEEKMAELNHIAYCLGARMCSVEIVEVETEGESRSAQMTLAGKEPLSMSSGNKSSKNQSGKTSTNFEGHDNPQKPSLKWFAHDDNIKWLIETRLQKAIKNSVLELKGSNSETMSKKIACAIDDILKIKGNISMEKQVNKEHSRNLIYEIEF